LFNSFFGTYSIELISSYPLNIKTFSTDQSFSKLPSKISFFLLVDRFIRFEQISFEKQLAALCPFSKEFCEHSRSLSTNRKKGIKIHKNVVNELVILIRFWWFQKYLVSSG
jgi:hypothetical protein